jgi:hypothetical protein
VQAAADRRTERSDSDILVSEYHKVGVCARESAAVAYAPCVGGMSQPTPARARVLPFVESQTTWNAEREGGAFLDPV